MNKLKERLFGLIVVIALGVIFIPMLLENTQNPKSSVMQDVPAVPVVKHDVDKNAKPEVLVKLKDTPIERPVVHDEEQPIADRPSEAAEPGFKEDLKLKEKLVSLAQEKVEQEQSKLVQEKLEEEKRHQAEVAAKVAEEKQHQAQEAAEKLAEDKRRQAEIANAKIEQARLEQQKLANEKQQRAERTPAKAAVKLIDHPEKPAKSYKTPVHSGWVVQMGSFAEHRNASALLKKLKAAGYPAFTRDVNRRGMDLTIVMVGPHVRREDADRLCSTLAMKFQIDGIIVRYEPR